MDDFRITSVGRLRELYPEPIERVVLKAVGIIDDGAAAMIAASPFLVFATTGESGLDCSPKGGEPGFVHVQDERTLLLPDWSGNNRIDGLLNLIKDPRVGLIFFYPGHETEFRVNGIASISTDPSLTSRFENEGRKPRVVIVITVAEAFIHCGRSVKFGRLWDAESFIPKEGMPDLREVVNAHVEHSRSQLEGTSSNE